MSQFEYTVVPAPTRGEKTRDAKTPGSRYALALSSELNRMAREGWEYVRADVLPSEERSGLTGRSTVYHNLLVFRRSLAAPGTGQDARQGLAAPAGGAAPVAASRPAADTPQQDGPVNDPPDRPAKDPVPDVRQPASP